MKDNIKKEYGKFAQYLLAASLSRSRADFHTSSTAFS
jgi:hypothetical protein